MTNYNSDEENEKYNKMFYTSDDADFEVIVKDPDSKKKWYIERMKELWKIGVDLPDDNYGFGYSFKDLDEVIAYHKLMLKDRDSIRMSFRRYITHWYNIYQVMRYNDYYAKRLINLRAPRLWESILWATCLIGIPAFLISSAIRKIVEHFLA